MKTEGDIDDVVDVVQDGEVDQPENLPQDPPAAETEQVVVTLGEDPDGAEEDEVKAAPAWVKDLRKRAREQERKIREQEQQIKALSGVTQKEELGKRPSLSDDDINYDEEAFASRLLEWNNKKAEIERRQQSEAEKVEKANQAFQTKLEKYNTGKKDLRVDDFEESEEVVLGILNATQQGIIVAYAERPELLVYAIGRNSKELQRLAAISDPIEFALEIRSLEKEKLKVATRKPETSPERTVSSNANISSSVDKHLERLEAEADRTGDRSKVVAYKRSLKQKSA